MIKILSLPTQVFIFLGLSIFVMCLTAILSLTNQQTVFARFFGDIHPIIVMVFIILLGILLITFLTSNTGLMIYRADGQGILWGGVMLVVVSGIIIGIDVTVRFPEDLNVAFPQSLAFYPVIGYVVEVIFHLLPITLLFIIGHVLFKQMDANHLIWACLIIVAFFEPVYQTIGFVGAYPAWVVGYVFLHVLVINLAQLIALKQYDFVTMFSIRMMYYAIWHIIWGHIRLVMLNWS